MSITPAQFVRSLYRQLESGKGMRFSAEEMDMLVEMGGIDAVSAFAADWVKRQSVERLTATRVDEANATAKTYRQRRLLRDHELTVEEAGQRALEMCRPKKLPEKSYLTAEGVEASMRRARIRTKQSHKCK